LSCRNLHSAATFFNEGWLYPGTVFVPTPFNW
jgi:hypothetical protein